MSTVSATGVALLPAVVFAVAWVVAQDRIGNGPGLLIMLVSALICPGWIAWAALRAKSDAVVVLLAIMVSAAVPSWELMTSSGSRLVRLIDIGLIGFALLLGVVVATRVMRRGGSTDVVLGATLGTLVMLVVLTPLLSAMFIVTTGRPVR